MDLGNFVNGIKAEEETGGVLKSGVYDVFIEKINPKDTKAGGKALNLQLRVFGAKCGNAVIFDWINLMVPSSEKASEIGKRRLKKIIDLVGHSDTTKMIGGKMSVVVGVQTSEQYGDKNVVKSYLELDTDSTPISSTPNGLNSFSANDIPF